MLLIFVQNMFAHPLSGNIAGQVFGANANRKDAFITSSPNEQTNMRTVGKLHFSIRNINNISNLK